MDLSNYRLIESEVKRVKGLSVEDKEDLAHDIVLKLLEHERRTEKPPKFNKAYIKQLIWNWKRNKNGKQTIIYDSMLAERAIEKGAHDEQS